VRPPRADRRCAVAFLDPPYRSGLAAPALTALGAAGWLVDEAIAVAELAAREEFAPPAGFVLIDERVYGAARFVLLRRGADGGST
jgi:16S rRNA (guanine966-N2)-methyltransferase